MVCSAYYAPSKIIRTKACERQSFVLFYIDTRLCANANWIRKKIINSMFEKISMQKPLEEANSASFLQSWSRFSFSHCWKSLPRNEFIDAIQDFHCFRCPSLYKQLSLNKQFSCILLHIRSQLNMYAMYMYFGSKRACTAKFCGSYTSLSIQNMKIQDETSYRKKNHTHNSLWQNVLKLSKHQDGDNNDDK